MLPSDKKATEQGGGDGLRKGIVLFPLVALLLPLAAWMLASGFGTSGVLDGPATPHGPDSIAGAEPGGQSDADVAESGPTADESDPSGSRSSRATPTLRLAGGESLRTPITDSLAASSPGSSDGPEAPAADAAGLARGPIDRLQPASAADVASLAAARDLELEGRREAARAAFATLAEGASTVSAEAATHAARLHVEDDDYAAARALLAPFPTEALPAEGIYLWGVALEETGDLPGALRAFELYGERQPVMADVSAMARGNVLFAMARYADAAPQFETARTTTPDSGTRFLAAIRRGSSLLRTATVTDTVAAYEAAYAAAGDDRQRAQALSGALAAREAAGHHSAALDIRARAVNDLASTDLARASLRVLESEGRGPAHEIAARVLAAHGEHDAAVRRFEAALAIADAPAVRVALARSHVSADRVDAALAALGPAVEASGRGGPSSEALWLMARTLEDAGRVEEALQAFNLFAASFPGNDLASGALWRRAGLLAERDGNASGAEAYLDLARRYPQSPEGQEAAFRAGLLAWRAGDLVGAESAWRALAAGGDPSDIARARHWLGRLRLAAGDPEGAQAEWRAAVVTDPDGFYAIQARRRLGDAEPPLAEDGRPVEVVLSEWAAAATGDPGAWATAGARAAAVTDRRRAEAWLLVGERDIAARTMARAADPLAGDAAALAALAHSSAELGLHASSVAAASRAEAHGGKSAALLRLQYPTPFETLFAEAAVANGLSPATLYGLVRQESRFEPTAVSSVGARGLTQVMPATGEWIAGQLGMSGFDSEQLNEPSLALAFGAFYLSRQLELPAEHPYAAYAAYNGGPGNSRRWWDSAAGDPELFVELIDFAETRRFVRLVTENVRQYERLYPRLATP